MKSLVFKDRNEAVCRVGPAVSQTPASHSERRPRDQFFQMGPQGS
jgi:hypothetical protein